jgi:hypothetical protein
MDDSSLSLQALRADGSPGLDLRSAASKFRQLAALKPLKPRQRRFLIALVTTSLKIEPAARKIGLEPRTHYTWLEQPKYAEAFAFVKTMWADYLEADMMADALTGQLMPVTFKGQITGYFREKNTREREILLKGLKPQYRESWSIQQAIAPTAVSITLAHAPQTPENSLNKLADTTVEAKIINPNQDGSAKD